MGNEEKITLIQESEDIAIKTPNPIEELEAIRIKLKKKSESLLEAEKYNSDLYIKLIDDIIEQTKEIQATQKILESNPGRKPVDAFLYGSIDLDEITQGIKAACEELEHKSNPNLLINLDTFARIKEQSNKLPASKYKDTLNTFLFAFGVFALGMAAFLCPPIIPFAIPVIGYMTSLNFIVGSVAMGMACHFGLKSFLNHAHQEKYKKTELDTLIKISELGDVKVKSDFESAYRDIECVKETVPIQASIALEKIKKILSNDLNGYPQELKIIQDEFKKIKENLDKKNNSILTSLNAALSTAPESFKAACSTAYEKYGWFLLIGVTLAFVDLVFTGLSGAFVALGISALVGFSATLLYEATAPAAKKLVSSIAAVVSPTAEYRSEIQGIVHVQPTDKKNEIGSGNSFRE